MSPSALVPSGVKAVQPGRINSDLATKPFRQLHRQQIKSTYLKLKAITTLALVLLIVAAVLPMASLAAGWTPTGSLATARADHSATLLPNGKVLVAGGQTPLALTSAELYDPVTGTWSATGSLVGPRCQHTATLLPNGQVLVAGGAAADYLTSAELYDPVTGTWSATGSLATGRHYHTATLLPNGQVLVAGGDYWDEKNNHQMSDCELYNPATGLWSNAGSPATPRLGHTATLLPNGKVLVAGGGNGSSSVASAELYDPTGNGPGGSWSATGSLATARGQHTATLLPGGQVLVVGGIWAYDILAELYNPAMGTWSGAGTPANIYISHTATLLPNGKVLVAAGANKVRADLYDPRQGTWSVTSSLSTGRYKHTATLLPNGKVLVAGGQDSNYEPLSSAELYNSAGFGPSIFELLLQ